MTDPRYDDTLGPFWTLDYLIGPARRNWAHYVQRSAVENLDLGQIRTLCGFSPLEIPNLARNCHAGQTEAECPDCARKFANLGKRRGV